MNGQGYQPGVDIMIHVCWLQGYYIFWESPTRKKHSSPYQLQINWFSKRNQRSPLKTGAVVPSP